MFRSSHSSVLDVVEIDNESDITSLRGANRVYFDFLRYQCVERKPYCFSAFSSFIPRQSLPLEFLHDYLSPAFRCDSSSDSGYVDLKIITYISLREAAEHVPQA